MSKIKLFGKFSISAHGTKDIFLFQRGERNIFFPQENLQLGWILKILSWVMYGSNWRKTFKTGKENSIFNQYTQTVFLYDTYLVAGNGNIAG